MRHYRFLVAKEFRRRSREPIQAAEPLDAIQEPTSRVASPSTVAISREEEAILWRALERIPDVYREPLILFYREEKSIVRVAAELELSEDAVKQRLSRGRKLLHDEVVAFVEGTLSRSAPGQKFSGAVLTSLPSAPTATIGGHGIARNIALAKSGFLSTWLALLAPLAGIFGGVMAHWLIVRSAPTARERRLQKLSYVALWIFILGWCVAGQFAVRVLRQRYMWRDHSFYAVMTGFWWFYSIVVATFSILLFRRIMTMRQQGQENFGIPKTAETPPTVGSSLAIAIGLSLACFLWLIFVAWWGYDAMSAKVIAGSMVVLAVAHFLLIRGQFRLASLRVVLGYLALLLGFVLVIVNLRLDVWLAAIRGTDLAEIHCLLPTWVVPFATLTLLIWIAGLVTLTNPRLSHSKLAQR